MSCDDAPSTLHPSILMRKHSKVWVFQQDICKNIPLLGLLRNNQERKRRNEHQRTESLFALIYSPLHVLRHWITHLPHKMMYLLLSIFQTSQHIYQELFLQRTLSPRIHPRGWVPANPHFSAFPSQLWALNIMWVSQLLFHSHVQGLQMLNMYVSYKKTTWTPH